jgi:hypothetical protein
MNGFSKLHQTLQVACLLLDDAAGQIRDASLPAANEHIQKIGEALVAIYEIQGSISKLSPKLEEKYKESPPEVRQANRRLGEALVSAYGLANHGRLPEPISLLTAFSNTEPSEFHRSLAKDELEKLVGKRPSQA